MEAARFIPSDIATKLTIALGIGLIVGFEREWSNKDLGVRTFALVSLLGMLCTLGSIVFAWVGMAAVIVVVGMMNAGNLRHGREPETTTSVASSSSSCWACWWDRVIFLRRQPRPC